MSEYRPRVVDAEVKKLLEMSGAVEIRGAKWCGNQLQHYSKQKALAT